MYQRVDKKNPKIVPKENLHGYSFKRSDKTGKVLVEVDESNVFVHEYFGGILEGLIHLDKEDIPTMVNALWAAYALIESDEQRNLENK